MKRSPLYYVAVAVGVFVALGLGLWFVHPLAPLLLAVAVAIWLPLFAVITRHTLGQSYEARSDARRQALDSDGDVAAFLAAEETEAAGVSFRYWPGYAKAQSLLNRAEALAALGRKEEAMVLAAQLEETQRLGKAEQKRLDALVAGLQEAL